MTCSETGKSLSRRERTLCTKYSRESMFSSATSYESKAATTSQSSNKAFLCFSRRRPRMQYFKIPELSTCLIWCTQVTYYQLKSFLLFQSISAGTPTDSALLFATDIFCWESENGAGGRGSLSCSDFTHVVRKHISLLVSLSANPQFLRVAWRCVQLGFFMRCMGSTGVFR